MKKNKKTDLELIQTERLNIMWKEFNDLMARSKLVLELIELEASIYNNIRYKLNKK